MLVLLFAVAAFGLECETHTCIVCKTVNTSCDWYGFDCLSKTSSEVTSLSLPETPTCPVCQAGNCGDCLNQTGCAWFANAVPGVPGICGLNTSSTPTYSILSSCPTCNAYSTCSDCTTQNVSNCGWYVLPGNVGGKCREASPDFAYTQVNAGSCAAGNPCTGVATCQDCQAVANATNASLCSWYTSKSPSFYNSKCDTITPGVVDGTLYTVVVGTCPVCAGTSCLTCLAETGCKWVAVSLGLTTAFGQCLQTITATPAAKTQVSTCPATCQVYSCNQCTALSACTWFTGSSIIDDSCDLSTSALLNHPTQTAATTPCAPCLADRCYECNGLAGCGWYAKEELSVILEQGCYATASPPSGRVLLSNSDSKCKGVPGSSSHVTVSIGVLLGLALLA